MIGTMYDRLAACVDALLAEEITTAQLSIEGHPEALRQFAICFDVERSKREIDFVGRLGVCWRSIPIFENGRIAEKDRLWLCIERNRVIVVPINGFAHLEDQRIRVEWKPFAERALARALPRAAP